MEQQGRGRARARHLTHMASDTISTFEEAIVLAIRMQERYEEARKRIEVLEAIIDRMDAPTFDSLARRVKWEAAA